MFVSDFILNGAAHGEVAGELQELRYDTGLLRPYFDKKGMACVTVNTGRTTTMKDPRGGRGLLCNAQGIPIRFPVVEKRTVAEMMARGIVTNATTMLRKDEWIDLDNTVIRAARLRMRAWSDLESANSLNIDGMSRITMEYEMMSDPGEAFVDMDGMTEGRNDAPYFGLQGTPLPITHSDFWYSARKLAISRRGSTPIDSVLAEAAGHRIAERIEKTLIGLETGIDMGPDPRSQYTNNNKVYGYLNFPQRSTKTNLTTPDGTNAASTIADIIAMRETMYAAGFYGPFMIYHSTDWDAWFDRDYYITNAGTVSGGTKTLRERLEAIDGISAIRRLDYLTSATNPYTLIMVQMTPNVVRAINGMGITTVQWPSMGGMRLNIKVMAIKVPQFRFDINSATGVIVGTTS